MANLGSKLIFLVSCYLSIGYGVCLKLVFTIAGNSVDISVV
jgi:hypothetical protein